MNELNESLPEQSHPGSAQQEGLLDEATAQRLIERLEQDLEISRKNKNAKAFLLATSL